MLQVFAVNTVLCSFCSKINKENGVKVAPNIPYNSISQFPPTKQSQKETEVVHNNLSLNHKVLKKLLVILDN